MSDEECLFIEVDPKLEIAELKAKIEKLERHNAILQSVIENQADHIEALSLDLHIEEHKLVYIN